MTRARTSPNIPTERWAELIGAEIRAALESFERSSPPCLKVTGVRVKLAGRWFQVSPTRAAVEIPAQDDRFNPVAPG